MQRTIYKQLQAWRNSPVRKSLLIRGARQVGKTWLVRQFGNEFENLVELNFEENPELKTFFDGNLDPAIITTNLSNYFGVKITPGETLLFFDEIQACPRAITAMRYFHEKMPQLHVIGAGSLIEFELENISIPVGRIESIYLYPLSFREYLVAIGRDDLCIMLAENAFGHIEEPIHRQLLAHVRDHSIIGGMPEVVHHFIKTANIAECQKLQTDIIETYRKDFAKYAKRAQIKYLRMVFDAAPRLLGNKFIHAHVSSEIKSREIGAALDLLEMAGVVYKVHHSSCDGIPLGASVDTKKFKVLFFDVGLAQRLLGLDIRPLLLDPNIMTVNKGSIAELFVGLELIAYGDFDQAPKLYYWHRESRGALAEVDYVTTLGSSIVPIEVKSGATGKMHSLKQFLSQGKAGFGLKVSQAGFSKENNIYNIPLYGIEGAFEKLKTNLSTS